MTDSNDISVLVVDDEAPNIDSLRRIFEREGFAVLTATSGRNALDVCRRQPVHVVVSDLMMPGMNGIELVKALKTVVPDAEVVLMTAFGTVEKAVEAMRAGAYDFVEKPLKRLQMFARQRSVTNSWSRTKTSGNNSPSSVTEASSAPQHRFGARWRSRPRQRLRRPTS
jgi:two-component system response regulator HydG